MCVWHLFQTHAVSRRMQTTLPKNAGTERYAEVLGAPATQRVARMVWYQAFYLGHPPCLFERRKPIRHGFYGLVDV